MENNILLQELRSYLLGVVEKIDTGQCKLGPSGITEVIGIIKRYTDTTRELTKTEASEYLHVSTSTFDRMVKEGKIPKGHKVKRNRILTWSTLDLDSLL